MSEEKKQCDSTSCDKESCAGCSHAKGGGIPKEKLNAHSHIKKVIGVISGKGGVGKSFVTASLANEMAFQGYKVGIMDADITGPSIPRMYGLKGSSPGQYCNGFACKHGRHLSFSCCGSQGS